MSQTLVCCSDCKHLKKGEGPCGGDYHCGRAHLCLYEFGIDKERVCPHFTPAMKKHKVLPCPYCGKRQKIEKPPEGIFPLQECRSLEHNFYVNPNLTIRKLTEQESKMLKEARSHFAQTSEFLIK